jgi:hypothetical protein
MLAIDQWLTEQQNSFVDDDRDRSNCSKCGSAQYGRTRRTEVLHLRQLRSARRVFDLRQELARWVDPTVDDG